MIRLPHGALLLLASATPFAPTLAVDLVPQDVVPPPPGLTTVQLSYSASVRGDLFREGKRQASDTRLDLDAIALRIGRTFQWRQKPAYVRVDVARGRIDPGGSLQSFDANSGIGDLNLMLAAWPYVDRDAERYVGVAAYLRLPTGAYDPRKTIGLNTNIGQNRLAGALQAGYGQRLVGPLAWMIAGDVAVFGDNDEYFGPNPQASTFSQRPIFSTQTALTYQLNPSASLGLSYFYNSGGETRLGQSDWHNRIDLHRYGVTAQIRLPVGRLTIEYGGDITTHSGLLEETRWAVRLSTAFR